MLRRAAPCPRRNKSEDSPRIKKLTGDANSFGRKLYPAEALRVNAECRKRVEILHETLERLGTPADRDHWRSVALSNLARWASLVPAPSGVGGADAGVIRVLRGDWGVITSQLTKEYGTMFAVLNMANAYSAGGGYVEGMPAQEENMFRRTDCHFYVDEKEYDRRHDRYFRERSDLINAAVEPARVLLDHEHPRVCVRGPEDRADLDLGYKWLEEGDVFPFLELRAAAVDLRDGRPYVVEECRRRVEAQLDTLAEANIRHFVLSAFGCGAFLNPAGDVARCYRQALDRRRKAAPADKRFACAAFAIFDPGYGPDNFTPFEAELGDAFSRETGHGHKL